MRLSPILVMLSLLAIFLAFPAAEARPSPACVDIQHNGCPGWYCVDADLDGQFEWNECGTTTCGIDGCCGGPCPPPPAANIDVAVPEPAGALPAATSATCTGYVNVLGSKQRTCVDPAAAPECGAYTESYSMIGYWRSCYGTAAWCNSQTCVSDIAIDECFGALRLCLE